MSLSPAAPRTLHHTRRVVYHGYARADGLWDIEGELTDSKPHPTASLTGGPPRPANAPVHSMAIRATVDRALVVQAIEVSMEAFPLGDCLRARPALQGMVGCSMTRGWRKAIQTHLDGVASCTHLRELLANMATAAFQTLSETMGKSASANTVPPFVDQCTGWDRNGEGVRVHYPQFYGRHDLARPQAPASGLPKPSPLPEPAALQDSGNGN